MEQWTFPEHAPFLSAQKLRGESRGFSSKIFFLERTRQNAAPVDLLKELFESIFIGNGADNEIGTVEDGGFRQKGSRRFDGCVAGLNGLLRDGEVFADNDVDVLIVDLVAHDGTPVCGPVLDSKEV